jgi:NAD(P)-dependent dehydrogenase (short-subunit alcohol dehydrogenase family)
VNAASLAAKIRIPSLMSYGTSNHAVAGMTRIVADEDCQGIVGVNARDRSLILFPLPRPFSDHDHWFNFCSGSIDTKTLAITRDAEHVPK